MNVPQPPPMPVTQINLQDESHLNLLAVFHYVIGGLCLLGLGFLVLHFVMMTFFFGMASTMPSSSAAPAPSVVVEAPGEVGTEVEPAASGTEELSATPTPPTTSPTPAHFLGFPKEMMAILVVFYVVMGVFISAVAVANFMSAGFIKKRKNRTFSLVVAGINCLQMPFGTVLGVFTIIVLMRPSVQTGYGANLAV